ncbi:MAG: NAD(+)/NADH kinase [Clostridiales bacterium]|nr:NAD(+)/NADH kinase [Clostridiales bacterium]
MIKLGIISNLSKDITGDNTKEVLNGILERSMIPLVTPSVYQLCQLGNLLAEDEIYKQSDLILVLGGDGTILHSSRKAAEYQKPLLGINLGHLGFLAEAEMVNLPSILDALALGKYKIDKRMMIEAKVMRGQQVLKSAIALNDVIVSKGVYGRIIHLNLNINGEFVNYYAADGLLVSSPTGSTAYSLSAGGPIIDPEMECLLVTPVSPHTLNSRPIVTHSSSLIEIESIDKNRDVQVTIDGQQIVNLTEGDRIIIEKANQKTHLIRISGYNFYKLLRNKLFVRNV